MATPVADSVSPPAISNSNGTLTDEFINGLVQGSSWTWASGPHNLTYSFSINDTLVSNWTPQLKATFVQALTAWSNVANITFTESGSGGVFTVSPADIAAVLTGNELQTAFEGAVGLGIFPDPAFADEFIEGSYTPAEYPNPEGDVFFDDFYPGYSFTAPGGFALYAMLHELGHALGLKHPHDDGGNERPDFTQLVISSYDTVRWTVMSYQGTTGLASGNPATPMPLDILAIQQIYGANMSYHAGDDVYTLANDGVTKTIWDAGGIDTFDASTLPFAVTIDLNPGAFSSHWSTPGPLGNSGIAIAYNVTIENALGTLGNDTLIGNDADNDLDGGNGADSMIGGAGDDIYHVNDGGDAVVELQDGGIDTIVTVFDTTLGQYIENVTLAHSSAKTVIGNDLDNALNGNAFPNVLVGGNGNDTLNGGLDVDTMSGGAGDDTYIVDVYVAPTPATYLELHGDPGNFLLNGTTVRVTPESGSFTISLLDEVPNGIVDGLRLDYFDGINDFHVIYSARTHGRVGYILGPGSFGDSYLYADNFPGTLPNRASFDVGGNDWVSSSATGIINIYDLVIDYSGVEPILTRLRSDFVFYRNATPPALHGKLDFNYGSPGLFDIIVEAPDGGIDRVLSNVTHVLQANVENLELTGNAEISGIGNELNNSITANGSPNLLAGMAGDDTLMGGGGIDTLVGGDGNDLYTVSSTPTVDGNRITFARDTVSEGAGQGSDTISTSGSYTLGDDFENLLLFGQASWRAEVGTGNTLDNLIMATGSARNRLYGLDGNDTLDGGAGADQLFGGSGDDVLVWDAADTLIDGGAGADILRIDGAGNSLNLSGLAGGKIQNIEVIDLAGSGSNTLALTLADVLAISPATDTLTIDGDAGDAVNGSGWISGDVSGGYRTWTQGAATLLVDTEITANLG